MIHTLFAIDSRGCTHQFADLVSRRASLKRDRFCPLVYWLSYPDESARAVSLHKRPRADVHLERHRAAWHDGNARALASRFTDALRRPRETQSFVPPGQRAGRATRETPDEIVKRLGLDATFFNSAYIRRVGLDASRPRETPDEMVKSLGLDCPWDGARYRKD